MRYKIRGTTLQLVEIELESNESVFTQSGGMSWMSSNISMSSEMKGGFAKALKRTLVSESMFMVTYTCTSGTGLISFCSDFPGNIIPLDIKEGESIICQKDAFFVAESSVHLNVKFMKKMGVGLFGGEGFFLQEIVGPGKAFLSLAGEITVYQLQKGQTLKVDPGYIGAFEPTVDYSITKVSGFKNILFGGEGLFLATLTGPGKVWLQSMPLSRLAKRLGYANK